MEVAKLAPPPNLEVRFVSCNESAIKRWLSSELEETVFSLTHEVFMSKHHTVTLMERAILFPFLPVLVSFGLSSMERDFFMAPIHSPKLHSIVEVVVLG